MNDQQRKEEQIKHIAGLITNIGLGVLGFGVLRPMLDDSGGSAALNLALLVASAVVAIVCWAVSSYLLLYLEEID